jgi:hypothetical protein
MLFCIADDPHNQLVIAYNLVIDNKRIETAKAEYKDFFAVGGDNNNNPYIN